MNIDSSGEHLTLKEFMSISRQMIFVIFFYNQEEIYGRVKVTVDPGRLHHKSMRCIMRMIMFWSFDFIFYELFGILFIYNYLSRSNLSFFLWTHWIPIPHPSYLQILSFSAAIRYIKGFTEFKIK